MCFCIYGAFFLMFLRYSSVSAQMESSQDIYFCHQRLNCSGDNSLKGQCDLTLNDFKQVNEATLKQNLIGVIQELILITNDSQCKVGGNVTQLDFNFANDKQTGNLTVNYSVYSGAAWLNTPCDPPYSASAVTCAACDDVKFLLCNTSQRLCSGVISFCQEAGKESKDITAAIAGACLGIFVVAASITLLCRKRLRTAGPPKPDEDRPLPVRFSHHNYEDVHSRSQPTDEQHTHSEVQESVSGVDEEIYAKPYIPPAATEDDLYSQLEMYRLLKRDRVKMFQPLGSGQFGEVRQGYWQKDNNCTVEVAIKILKEGSSTTDRVKFLQEAAIMSQFRHPNVVATHGVIRDGSPILLVLELMSCDLRRHLISMTTLPPDAASIFFQWSVDIASGMAYLTSRGFIHRDLAARNVMINSKGECKIGDFGMARDLSDESYYFSQGGLIPVKWSAPEAVCFRKFSTKSDVWSYGVVLWEIFECGRKPYAFWSNERVLDEVQNGFRLPQPKLCPDGVYRTMLQCWHPARNERPEFYQILLTLKGLK